MARMNGLQSVINKMKAYAPRIQRREATNMNTTRPTIYPLAVEAEVIEALRLVYDPEIPVNIYELGLIYDIEVDNHGFVDIEMTLTSPACPVAGTLPGEVEEQSASGRGRDQCPCGADLGAAVEHGPHVGRSASWSLGFSKGES